MLHNNNNNNSDDDNEHHGTLPRSPTPLKSSCSTKHVTKKLLYIGILLFTLVIICLSTNDTTRMLIQVLFQYHEPSIRIFRSLIEIILLLICTAVSIRIYVHYISSHIIHSLLFQSIDSQNNDTNNMNDEEVVEDESYDRNYDGTLFQSVHNNDTHDHTNNNNNNNNNDENDANHHLETAAPLPTTTTTTSRRTPYIDDDNDDDDNCTKMPSSSLSSLHDLSMSILIMALDLFIYTCMTLIFYLVSAIHTLQPSLSSSSTMSTSSSSSTTNHHQQQQPSMVILIARIAAPTFPLLLFLFCMIRCIQHYRRYKEFYILLSYTMSAPFYNVTFRDGMIGDILTSMVRPMQDIAFTICYLLFGLRGYWSDHQNDYYEYMQQASTTPDATSMTIPSILSSGSNITTSFGNAWVQSADAYVPSMERSWIVHTAILPACMISPLWWRFLQTIRQSYDDEQRWPYLGNSMKYFFAAQVAMLGVYHPSVRQSTVWICSFVLATLYQIYWDVFMDWGLLVYNRKTSMWNLRTQRLYPRKSFYWMLLIINTVLRFCWTLSFVPFQYLSSSGVLTNNLSSDAWANILIPTIASAEIIRRTLWGLIRVEWEAIKVKNEMSNISDDNDREMEMTPMKVIDASESWDGKMDGSSNRYKLPFTSDMSSMNKIQIFGELCLYTTTFAVLGLIIAAHRGTL